MNLTYLANIRFPTEKAHGLQIAKTIDWLNQLGCPTQLIVPKRRLQPTTHPDPQTAYHLNHPLKPQRLNCLDLLRFSRPNTPVLYNQLAFTLQILTFSFSALIYLLSHPKAKVIYTRDPYVLLPLLILNRHFYFEIHNPPRTRIGILLHHYIFARTQGVVAISQSLTNKLKRLGLYHHQTIVLHSASDPIKPLSRRQARRLLHLPQTPKIILYTGSLYEYKGVYDLVKAITLLPSNPRLIIIGGSPNQPSSHRFIDYLNQQNHPHITYLPHQPNSTIHLYTQAADVLVLPTNASNPNTHTGSPLKLFLYLHAHRPVVATNLPAHREIINNPKIPLVAPGNPKQLALALGKMLNHPQLSRQQASMLQQIALRHTWKHRSSLLIDFINTTS